MKLHTFPVSLMGSVTWSRTKLIFSLFVCLKNCILVSECFKSYVACDKWVQYFLWWLWGERVVLNLRSRSLLPFEWKDLTLVPWMVVRWWNPCDPDTVNSCSVACFNYEDAFHYAKLGFLMSSLLSGAGNRSPFAIIESLPIPWTQMCLLCAGCHR